MADQVFPITFKPGILRDGSPFQGEYCTNGQWTRFFRGFPQNIGGMATLPHTEDPIKASAISSALYIDQQEAAPSIFIGFLAPYYVTSKNRNYSLAVFTGNNGSWDSPQPLEYDKISFEGAYWQIVPIIFQSGPESKRSILCVPRLIANITNSNAVPIIWNYINGAFVEVTTMMVEKQETKYSELLKEMTGGVLFINPYLFIYGNNGLVRWSKSRLNVTADKPFKFDILKYSINISTDKVIYGAGVRGGTASPSALFWTLSSVVRLTNIGSVNPDDVDDISFKKEIITNDSSILSSNCVVEYDGIL